MKAALIFAEMRGQAPYLADNITAHILYKLWRAQRDRWLADDASVVYATQMLGTDQLVTFALHIYAAGQTSEEKL